MIQTYVVYHSDDDVTLQQASQPATKHINMEDPERYKGIDILNIFL